MMTTTKCEYPSEYWFTVELHGFPPDGRYVVKLAPNGREHNATVCCHQIQLTGQRWPTEITNILGPKDQWKRTKGD
jgi:hypothetical protein